eukprot:CAMPEP_0172677026 /NCGR_PEP_ID=MMETSP1074-20121228/14388_1 /TAXON_ID=2916 /ORGANISM="Ceratium fusus, Strain PA161109" /LENGTH=82 /DNA_ID=CAMNT_0013494797 /DNA_START=654 /DNA_END=898 /DNA_ORIENTATION=+
MENTGTQWKNPSVVCFDKAPTCQIVDVEPHDLRLRRTRIPSHIMGGEFAAGLRHQRLFDPFGRYSPGSSSKGPMADSVRGCP